MFTVGINVLLHRAPSDLEIPCPKTGLFPFQLAATTSELDRLWCPDTSFVEVIYVLLRRAPMVLARLLTPESTSLLDDPVYQQLCKRELEFAQLERRQKRDRDELKESLDRMQSKYRKKQGSING
jgi:hypothetical protein